MTAISLDLLDFVWNVMAHAQKPDFIFQWNRRVHLNRQGRQFSWLLAPKVCTSAVVLMDTPSSEVVWRVLATHSIHQFPLHFPSHVSPCAITFQLDSTLCHGPLIHFPGLSYSVKLLPAVKILAIIGGCIIYLSLLLSFFFVP